MTTTEITNRSTNQSAMFTTYEKNRFVVAKQTKLTPPFTPNLPLAKFQWAGMRIMKSAQQKNIWHC